MAFAALEVLDDPAAVRRVTRPRVDEAAPRREDVFEERIGAGVVGLGGAGDIPAFTDTVEALSMYFSIKRSLFQFMWRSRSAAVLTWVIVNIESTT
jgi:hypothetical protein